MIRINLTNSTCFLKIRETLTRIGIANSETKKLYQSCHILFHHGQYHIAHFKELLARDGYDVNITDEDIQRVHNITLLLTQWGLCETISSINPSDTNQFRMISFAEKSDWELIPKYKFKQNRV